MLHKSLRYATNRLGIHHDTFAVAVLSFGSGMIHTIFMFYYVKVFLNHYHISQWWFQLSQGCFLVWNALNDPLFGYLQDMSDSWMRSRKRSIAWGSPFLALSFLLPWLNWYQSDSTPDWLTGLHLLASLFFYDGFFSFTLIAYCALFTELSADPAGRIRVVKYMQTAVMFAVGVVFLVDKVSNGLTDFKRFQLACVCIAAVAYICMWYTSTYAPDEVVQTTFNRKNDNDTTKTTGLACVKEILVSRDFHSLICANFAHICRSTIQLNFAAILVETLVPSDVFAVGSWHISAFYGVCAVLPQVLLISGSQMAVRYGAHRLLVISCGFSVVAGLLMAFVGRSNVYLILLYALVDSVTVHSFSPTFNILFPDFIDDDMIRHNRSSPLSSMIFSLNALFTKPAQSLAPMLAVWILNTQGYEEFQKKKVQSDPGTVDNIRDCLFYLMCLLPVAFSLVELVSLQWYRLSNRHLPIGGNVFFNPEDRLMHL